MKSLELFRTMPVLVALLATALLAAACGGLPEDERHALVLEFKEQGDAAEKAIVARHPNDELKQSEEFRAAIDRIRKEVLTKYGVSEEEAGEIFREGRKKGWW